MAAPTALVNGTPVTISVTDVEGKGFIDVVALMQLLGGKATYVPRPAEHMWSRYQRPRG